MTAARIEDIITPPDWTDAACRNYDPELWFPVAKPPNEASYRLPRDICATCPIREACLDYAMEREGARRGGSRYGMWGGLDPHERSLLARRTKAKRTRHDDTPGGRDFPRFGWDNTNGPGGAGNTDRDLTQQPDQRRRWAS